MHLKRQWWSVLVAAVLVGLVGVTAVAAGGEQFLPVLGVREGALRFIRIPRADGYYRLFDPPQCARWRHQRRAIGLGRVRNRLGRRPRRGVLRAPESQGVHGGGGGSSVRYPARLCPDGAGHARPDPPAHAGLWAHGRHGWAGVSVCLQPPDQLLESEHGQDPLHRPTGRRHGPAQGPENRPCLLRLRLWPGNPPHPRHPGRPVRLCGAAPGRATAGARPEGDLAAGARSPSPTGSSCAAPAS